MLKNKKFWTNAIIAFVAFIIVGFLIFKSFNFFTNHGNELEVPNLIGMPYEEAKKELENRGFKVETVDSLYELPEGVKEADFGDVIMQNPKPNIKVKKGRRFYLVIRTSTPPMVEMPDLINLSLRQAISTLEARGLKFGRAISKPGFPPVQKQLYKGVSIPKGTKIPKGSVIDVWVGNDSEGGKEVPVPNIVGMTRNDAIKALSNSGFNVGAEVFPIGVRDSSKAIVTRQFPTSDPEETYNQGGDVDLWYK